MHLNMIDSVNYGNCSRAIYFNNTRSRVGIPVEVAASGSDGHLVNIFLNIEYKISKLSSNHLIITSVTIIDNGRSA